MLFIKPAPGALCSESLPVPIEDPPREYRLLPGRERDQREFQVLFYRRDH